MAKKRKKSKSVPGPSLMDDRSWRARSDYETLCSAAEITRDSGRMRGVRSHAREQRDRAARISRLEGKIL